METNKEIIFSNNATCRPFSDNEMVSVAEDFVNNDDYKIIYISQSFFLPVLKLTCFKNNRTDLKFNITYKDFGGVIHTSYNVPVSKLTTPCSNSVDPVVDKMVNFFDNVLEELCEFQYGNKKIN